MRKRAQLHLNLLVLCRPWPPQGPLLPIHLVLLVLLLLPPLLLRTLLLVLLLVLLQMLLAMLLLLLVLSPHPLHTQDGLSEAKRG